MLTVFLRTVILYALMVLVLRAMGKRQLAGFQPFELATTIVIADLISTPMGEVSIPLLHGILPIAALFIMQAVLSVLCVKSDRFRAILSGRPRIVISKGEIDRKELSKLCIGVTDLIEGIREAGILNPAECGTAVIEANGTITAFPFSEKRPPNADEMNVSPGYEGLPMVLIIDGNVQNTNLAQTGKNLQWLSSQLAPKNLRPENVFFASLDTHGIMTVQPREGGCFSFSALSSSEIAW